LLFIEILLLDFENDFCGLITLCLGSDPLDSFRAIAKSVPIAQVIDFIKLNAIWVFGISFAKALPRKKIKSKFFFRS
jgi:hypothetical protein